MNILDEIVFAKTLGRNGYYTGKQAPAQDQKVLYMLKGKQVGDPSSTKLLKAWNKGWHEARESFNEYKQTFGGM